jgi:hypothetical protein
MAGERSGQKGTACFGRGMAASSAGICQRLACAFFRNRKSLAFRLRAGLLDFVGKFLNYKRWRCREAKKSPKKYHFNTKQQVVDKKGPIISGTKLTR